MSWGDLRLNQYQPIWIIPLPNPPAPIDRGTPHKCPCCDGKGTIKHRLDDGQLTAAVSYEETCPACHGEHVLWSKAVPVTITSNVTDATPDNRTNLRQDGGGGQ